MTKTRFKKALRRGLGSALITLKQHENPEEFKDIVLWCCLHVTSYDAQSEGNRSKYLYHVIDTFEDKAYFEDAIFERFLKDGIETWLFEQLCGLVYQFASNGSVKARNALYQKYETLFHMLAETRHRITVGQERECFEWLCIRLIKMDGFDTFKQIIRDISGYYDSVEEPDRMFMEWFYSQAKELFGNERVDDYLDTQAKVSKGVDALLKKELRYRPPHAKHEKPKEPTLQELMDGCKEMIGFLEKGSQFIPIKSRMYARNLAKCASMEELVVLANAAVEEKNEAMKVELLWIFRFVAFPLNKDYVIEWSKSKNENLRSIAFEMLNFLPCPQARNYAIKLLSNDAEVADAIALLCHNYQSQDEGLLFKSVKKLSVTYGRGDWHYAYMAIEELFREQNVKSETKILDYIYRNTLCSYCRKKIVETMHKVGVLTKEIVQECLYDSYRKTPDFAKEILHEYEK